MLLLPVVRLAPADSPIAMFESPLARFPSALTPKAELKTPVVLTKSAKEPKAELRLPVVLAWSAKGPKPALLKPVRLALVFPADWPTKVLLLPKLCRNRTPPSVMTPVVPPLVVLGRLKLPTTSSLAAGVIVP